MTREELLQALRSLKVETGSLSCLGCGHEHGCSIHGCAIIQAAEEVLTPQANAPLTLEELREMDGEPVWVTSVNNGRGRSWTLVDTKYEICREVHGGLAVFENYGKTWLAYRRKPEEESNA